MAWRGVTEGQSGDDFPILVCRSTEVHIALRIDAQACCYTLELEVGDIDETIRFIGPFQVVEINDLKQVQHNRCVFSDNNIADFALLTVSNIAVDAIFNLPFDRIIRGDDDGKPEIKGPVFAIPGTPILEDANVPSFRICAPISSFVFAI